MSKEGYVKLNTDSVQVLEKKLKQLKKEGCFISQNDRATYYKKLLDLQCRVEGMLIFSQNALFSILNKEFLAIKANETLFREWVMGNETSTSKYNTSFII